MRGKIIQLLATVAASACTFSTVPQPARAHGDVVMMKEVFIPGTIVVRTNERHLYYVTGIGTAFAILSASRRAGTMQGGYICR